MSDAGLERKVRRSDNDVQAIYDILTEIQGEQRRQGEWLVGVQEAQRRQGERLDVMDEHLVGLDGRVGSIDGKVTHLAEDMATVLQLLRAR